MLSLNLDMNMKPSKRSFLNFTIIQKILYMVAFISKLALTFTCQPLSSILLFQIFLIIQKQLQQTLLINTAFNTHSPTFKNQHFSPNKKLTFIPDVAKDLRQLFLFKKSRFCFDLSLYKILVKFFFLNFPQESQWIFRTFYILLTLYRVWHRERLHLKQNVVVTTFYNSYYFSMNQFL